MASPYDGIEEEDLMEIKAYFLRILKGKEFTTTNVPGLLAGKRVPSLEEARNELVLVQTALDACDPDKHPVSMTYIRAV